MPSSLLSECLIIIGHFSAAVFDVFVDCSASGYLSHLSPGLFTDDSILVLFFFLNLTFRKYSLYNGRITTFVVQLHWKQLMHLHVHYVLCERTHCTSRESNE